MKHFIAEKHLQGTLTQFSWQGYHDISQLKFTEDDFIWILTTDEDWPQTLLQAKQKVASVVLLTYRYDRVEMQAALNLGARAYCHALGKPSLYSSVVRVVDAGGIWMPNELLAALSPSVATSIKSKPVFTTLNGITNREKDVLSGILDGLSNKEIARKYGITERTVKEHVGSLLNKFGAKDRINLLLHLGEFSHLRDAL
jgi:two-component system nitrate/nitrite response regulator NarL